MLNLVSLSLYANNKSFFYTRLSINRAKSSSALSRFSLQTAVSPTLTNFDLAVVSALRLTPPFVFNATTGYARFNVCAHNYFPGMINLIQYMNGGSATIGVKAKFLVFFCEFFKYSWWFRTSLLIDLCVSDYISRLKRFEVVYCLISVTRGERLYFRVFTDELTPLSSVSKIFKSAGWLEREAWDMCGVTFAGHSDLRRILTDYGFLGFPLRKDFPLTGFFEIRYDDTNRQIVSESVNLIQELRLFFFSTVWVKF